MDPFGNAARDEARVSLMRQASEAEARIAEARFSEQRSNDTLRAELATEQMAASRLLVRAYEVLQQECALIKATAQL